MIVMAVQNMQVKTLDTPDVRFFKQVQLLNTGAGKDRRLCSKFMSTNHRLQHWLQTGTDRRKKCQIGLSAHARAKIIYFDLLTSFSPG